MEDAREKSIKQIVERAKQDKEDIIEYIDALITYRLPEITENSGRVSELFADLASQLNIGFSSDEQIKDLMSLYAEKLIALKQDLEALEITEEVLMGKESLLLQQAQEVVELIEPALEKAKNNFYTANKNTLLESYKQREEIQSRIAENKAKIAELKIQKAYLQGQLDITKRKKKREELQRKIKEIDDEIQDYEGKVLNLEIQEKDISGPKKGEEKPVSIQPMENQVAEDKQHEGEEQDDGVNR